MTNSQRYGAVLSILLFSLLLFHILVISGALPYQLIWGEKIASGAQMVQMEMVSIVAVSFMLTIAMVRTGWLNWQFRPALLQAGLVLMIFYFTLTAVGNLLAGTPVLRFIFAPLYLIVAILSIILYRSRD